MKHWSFYMYSKGFFKFEMKSKFNKETNLHKFKKKKKEQCYCYCYQNLSNVSGKNCSARRYCNLATVSSARARSGHKTKFLIIQEKRILCNFLVFVIRICCLLDMYNFNFENSWNYLSKKAIVSVCYYYLHSTSLMSKCSRRLFLDDRTIDIIQTKHIYSSHCKSCKQFAMKPPSQSSSVCLS